MNKKYTFIIFLAILVLAIIAVMPKQAEALPTCADCCEPRYGGDGCGSGGGGCSASSCAAYGQYCSVAACVECLSSTHCASKPGRTNCLNGNCVECTASYQCGSNKVCSASGTCVCPYTTPYWSSELNSCVQCLSNSNCASGQTCNRQGSCETPIPTCTDTRSNSVVCGGKSCGTATDNCGTARSCGSCTDPNRQYCVSGSCVQCTSGGDCGGGTYCSGSLGSPAYTCLCPSTSPTWCGSGCTNTKTDSSNCGGCGTQCYGGKVCTNSNCVCAPGSEWSSTYNSCRSIFTSCYEKGYGYQLCIDKSICDPNSLPEGALCPNSAYVCRYTLTDSSNCGGCDNKCPSNKPTCSNGVCVCTGTLCPISNICVYDFQRDNNNCGGCENKCTSPLFCSAGKCIECSKDPQCGSGQSCINGFCTTQCPGICTTRPPAGYTMDPNYDCGLFDDCYVCKSPKQVCSGKCVDTSSDANNCGGCGTKCSDPNKPFCVSGQCKQCLSNNDCGGGTTCVSNTCQCPSSKPYWYNNQCVECTSDSQCETSKVCSSNHCCKKGDSWSGFKCGPVENACSDYNAYSADAALAPGGSTYCWNNCGLRQYYYGCARSVSWFDKRSTAISTR